ncbi:flagellar basal body P-ring formation protein FlgA [Halomonas marinisediminis]|uniref:Flagella basal body P-ring formation protein FlgA n=1 Tax=Halomonas marinisediminis TaxID=2546095 RepID=A0ABY2D603_9GAMM|nr:flagellar basal body P-ring formation protein FlgA [Halomonas marinisediminis]
MRGESVAADSRYAKPARWHGWQMARICCSALWLFLLPFSAVADTTLEAEIADFLKQEARELGYQAEVSLSAQGLDAGSCPLPELFLPPSADMRRGRVVVGVRCLEQGETHYLRADVALPVDYLVVAEPIATGERVTLGQLRWERGDLTALPNGILQDPAELESMRARRSLRPGTQLRSAFLEKEPLVERRQAVTVSATGAAFRVEREGVALDAGGLGDWLRVQMGGGEVIEARVVGASHLEVLP